MKNAQILNVQFDDFDNCIHHKVYTHEMTTPNKL